MKNPERLCHGEYIFYRRQMQQIRRLAHQANQHPSEVLRFLLDQALTTQIQEPYRVMGNSDDG